MKYLDKNGLAYFWSKVKGWAMDNIVPLTRKINGKALNADITIYPKDIPYETSNVSDTMKDVRNVLLTGDTCTDNIYSESPDWSIHSQNVDYTKGTAPSSATSLFKLNISGNGDNFAKLEPIISTDNTSQVRAYIYREDGANRYIQQRADYSSGEGYLDTNVDDIYIGNQTDPTTCGETANGIHLCMGATPYIKLRRDGTNGPYVCMGYSGSGFVTTLQYGTATKNRTLKFPDISGGTLQLRDKRNFTVTDPNGVFTIEKAYYAGPMFFMYGYFDYTKPTAANDKVYQSAPYILDGLGTFDTTGISFVPNSSNYKATLRGRLLQGSSVATIMIKSNIALTANQYFYIYGMMKPSV